jgi:hypothetical protein
MAPAYVVERETTALSQQKTQAIMPDVAVANDGTHEGSDGARERLDNGLQAPDSTKSEVDHDLEPARSTPFTKPEPGPDRYPNDCPKWVGRGGGCIRNAVWMEKNCALSCWKWELDQHNLKVCAYSCSAVPFSNPLHFSPRANSHCLLRHRSL